MFNMLFPIIIGFFGGILAVAVIACVLFTRSGKAKGLPLKNNTPLNWAIGVACAVIVLLVATIFIRFVEKREEVPTQNESVVEQEEEKESEKEAVEEDAPITPLEEFTRWTIADVGMPEGEYNVHGGTPAGETQDKKAFYTAVKFPAGIDSKHNAELWIGEYSNGYLFQTQNDSVSLWHYAEGITPQIICNLVPDKLDLTTLVGEEIDIILTTEFINSDGTTTDVNVGLYINGELYDDQYYMLKQVPVDAFKQQVYVHNKWAGGKTIWISPQLKAEAQAVTLPGKLRKWTIEDVGFGAGEYSIQGGKATGATQDKKAFSTAVIFPEVTEEKRNAELWIGEQYNGLGFIVQNGTLVFKHQSSKTGEKVLCNLSPEMFELSSLLGQELHLTLTTEFVDSNGTTTDANIALYINGISCSNRYMKLCDVPVSSLKQQVYVYNRWAGGKVTWLSPTLKKDAPPVTAIAKLKKWTIKDVGMIDGDYNIHTGTATGDTLDQKAFSGSVIFPLVTEAKRNAEFWIGEQYNGLGLIVQNGNLILQHWYDGGNATTICILDPKKVGLSTLLNHRIQLTVTTEFVNNNGKTTDVNIGLYIDGTLYNGAYMKLEDVPVSSLSQQICVFNRWSGGKATGLRTY